MQLASWFFDLISTDSMSVASFASPSTGGAVTTGGLSSGTTFTLTGDSVIVNPQISEHDWPDMVWTASAAEPAATYRHYITPPLVARILDGMKQFHATEHRQPTRIVVAQETFSELLMSFPGLRVGAQLFGMEVAMGDVADFALEAPVERNAGISLGGPRAMRL